jgi:hypothetical protein
MTGSRTVVRGAHGTNVPRGLRRPVDPRAHGRFGKMFPDHPKQELSADATTALVAIIDNCLSSAESGIPAGFTYLGQFVDHDITFDPTSQSNRIEDPDATISFRTPRLDLDSLYGSGPKDQPFLYESRRGHDRGVKLLIGEARPWYRMGAIPDLPRNDQQRALIGDPRNDETVIIAQLHLLFLRFHNKVVDHLRADGESLAGPELFEEARRLVCWHYQWIIVHDFLSRFVDATLLRPVLDARKTFTYDDVPFIPVEFSGAAYRFGHSLVRDSYRIRGKRGDVHIFGDSDEPKATEHLGGFRQIPRGLAIDWSFFFKTGKHEPQSSAGIDPHIAGPLRGLPFGVTDAAVADGARPSLPRLNLSRANMLDVPPGPVIAGVLGAPPLDAQQLGLGGDLTQAIRDELLTATPLWYYVLCEADAVHAGRCLGPVGGRIVAETLVGLLVSDPQSYLAAQPSWTPELPGAAKDDFTMADLVRFTG